MTMYSESDHAALIAGHEAFQAAIAPPPDRGVREWAEEHFHLSPEDSAEAGKYRAARAPYQAGILDAVTEPGIDTVVLMTSSQVGKTMILKAVAGFYIHQDPAPMLMVQPTLDMAEAVSKDRLSPMFRDSPALQPLIGRGSAREAVLHKTFPGGSLSLAGANSAASLASRPVRIVFADEVDRYPDSAGDEGDPLSLAQRRNLTFWNRKNIIVSTPTIAGESRIEKAFNASDQRYYYVPCPHCDHRQVLRWANVQWTEHESIDEAAKSARYRCDGCGVLWSEGDRLRSLPRGEWRAHAPQHKGSAGFFVNILYSTFARLPEVVKEFLEKKDDPDQLQTFVNTALAELWVRKGDGEAQDSAALAARAAANEWPQGAVPDGVRFLTLQVDVQKRRFVCQVFGHGPNREMWFIDRFSITESPDRVGDDGKHLAIAPGSYLEDWQALRPIMARTYRSADGAREFPLRLTVVDSGGINDTTANAYAFHRANERDNTGHLLALLKGAKTKRARLVARSSTEWKKQQVPIYILDANGVKDEVNHALGRDEPGAGYVHFPAWTPPGVFQEMAAEQRTPTGWVKQPGKNNEAWDLICYAWAAYAIAGADRIDWDDPPEWAGKLDIATAKPDGYHTITARSAGKSFADLGRALNG